MPSLAHCKHEKVLVYELTSADQQDFYRRLGSVLNQNPSLDSGEFNLNFLTPKYARLTSQVNVDDYTS